MRSISPERVVCLAVCTCVCRVSLHAWWYHAEYGDTHMPAMKLGFNRVPRHRTTGNCVRNHREQNLTYPSCQRWKIQKSWTSATRSGRKIVWMTCWIRNVVIAQQDVLTRRTFCWLDHMNKHILGEVGGFIVDFDQHWFLIVVSAHSWYVMHTKHIMNQQPTTLHQILHSITSKHGITPPTRWARNNIQQQLNYVFFAHHIRARWEHTTHTSCNKMRVLSQRPHYNNTPAYKQHETKTTTSKSSARFMNQRSSIHSKI